MDYLNVIYILTGVIFSTLYFIYRTRIPPLPNILRYLPLVNLGLRNTGIALVEQIFRLFRWIIVDCFDIWYRLGTNFQFINAFLYSLAMILDVQLPFVGHLNDWLSENTVIKVLMYSLTITFLLSIPMVVIELALFLQIPLLFGPIAPEIEDFLFLVMEPDDID